MNSITDSDTVSTSDLLDLIQSDANSSRRSRSSGSSGGGGAPYYEPPQPSGSSRGRNNNNNNHTTTATREMNNTNNDPFSVRLTRQEKSSSRRRRASLSSEDGSEDNDSVGDMSGFDSYKYNSTVGGNSHHRAAARVKIRSQKKKAAAAAAFKRQRMPLGGGYGGMFESHNNDNSTSQDDSIGGGSSMNGTMDGTTDGSSVGTSHDGSSIGSVFSFASRMFTSKKKRSNPYTGSISGHSISSRSNYHYWNNSCLLMLSHYYLQLPFRLRYFVQLFSIVGVLLLASLNYFIAMEDNPLGSAAQKNHHRPASGINSQQQQHENYVSLQYVDQPFIQEGGGASPNQIPRLRVRDPLKFLHEDMHPNELLERATSKFRQSTRFGFSEPDLDKNGVPMKSSSETNRAGVAVGDGGGGGGDATKPFVYGWKSMPRQIYNDFSSGLSDDTKTIEHSKNTQHFQNMAQRQVGFSGHPVDEEGGEKQRPPPKGMVAYVLPVSTCYGAKEEKWKKTKTDTTTHKLHRYSPNQPKNEAAFRDFALMLRSMVHGHSYSNPASGSVYDYKMHAIIHPRAKKCRNPDDLFTVQSGSSNMGGDDDDSFADRTVVLQNLGYRVSVKESPLLKSSIVGSDYLSDSLGGGGGSSGGGANAIADLIRLYAYELEGYDAVVLLDYDTLILGPVDKAVDLIVDSNPQTVEDGGGGENGNTNYDNDSSIDAVFSWEHLPSLGNPQARASVVNLSFFLLRPSKETFAKLVSRYQNTPFSENRGWGSIGRGSFPGWMTTVGFLTYYYDEVANAAKVEMNRCAFGNTGEDYNADNSILITNGGNVECGNNGGSDNDDGASSVSNECNECSKSKLEDVSVADLSYCRAPWECGGGDDDDGGSPDEDDEFEPADSVSTATDSLSSGLCRQFQKTWFAARLQMEDVHPQLQKGSGKLCIDGQYQPMILMKPRTAYKPSFVGK
ncbi:hypothetical protein ACHAXR_006803 [Thalassiosira sp. AJA248-18]